MSLKMSADELMEFLEREFPQVMGEFAIEEVGEMRIRTRLLGGRAAFAARRHGVGPVDLRAGGCVGLPCVLAMIGPQGLAVTTNCSIDFMRKPAARTDLIADCRLLKLGRVLAVGEVLVFSDGMDAASGAGEPDLFHPADVTPGAVWPPTPQEFFPCSGQQPAT